MTDLSDTARLLATPPRGILAADESVASADKRLALYGIEGTEDMRQQFRDLFLAAPGIEEYLSGVILHEETLTQSANDGTPFAKLLSSRGIVPGIKVDGGTEPAEGSKDELITKGLLGLDERLANFRETYSTGFTKWRAVVKIEGDRLPTQQVLHENCKRLAHYAVEVQKAGMVPILEPEMLLEGNHSRVRAQEVLETTLQTLFDALIDQHVDLSGALLKTSMVLSGNKNARTDTPEEVAQATVEVLMKKVPREVPGIIFLSGGQTPDQATDNLRAIAKEAASKKAPWPLTFSYARALQEEALSEWKGEEKNVPSAREIFLKRLKKVSEAAQGH